MDSDIAMLLQIQDKDQRIANLQKQIDTVPADKAAINDKMDSAESLLETAKGAIQNAEKAIKAVEMEIGSVTQRKLDLLGKSHQIKKNDEYKAMLKEVETFDRKVSELETKQLECMDNLDKAKEMKVVAQGEVDTIKARLRGTINDLEVRATNCAEQITKVKEERDALARDIPMEVMRLYDRLMQKNRDNYRPVIAELVDDRCQGCFLNVVPQVRHKVHKDELVCCENCGVILYRPV